MGQVFLPQLADEYVGHVVCQECRENMSQGGRRPWTSCAQERSAHRGGAGKGTMNSLAALQSTLLIEPNMSEDSEPGGECLADRDRIGKDYHI